MFRVYHLALKGTRRFGGFGAASPSPSPSLSRSVSKPSGASASASGIDPTKGRIMKRWIAFAYPEKWRIMGGCVLLLVTSVFNVAVPLCFSIVCDELANFAGEKKKVDEEEAGEEAGLADETKSSMIPSSSSSSTSFSSTSLSSTSLSSASSSFVGKFSDFIKEHLFPPQTDQNSNDQNYRIGYFLKGLGGIFVVGSVTTYIRYYLFRSAGERIICRLRRQLYHSIIGKDCSYFDNRMTGDLNSRLSNDCLIIGNTLTRQLSDGVRSVAMLGMSGSLMYSISPALSSNLVLTVIPAFTVVSLFYGGFVRKWTKKTQDSVSDTIAISQERLSQIKTIKAFSRESDELARFTNAIEKVKGFGLKESQVTGLYYSLASTSTMLTMQVSMAAIFYSSVDLIYRGEISLGQLISFIFYTGYFGSSIPGLQTYYSDVVKSMAASEKIFEILDAPTTIHSPPKPQPYRPRDIERIIFDKVSFAYPMRPEAKIYDDLSISVEANKVTAIVGKSGSGKSTLISLLLRFYDPDQGSILIQQKKKTEMADNIKQFDLDEWRASIGMVSQEPVLFGGTIAENLRYGKPDASQEELEIAARNANALNFIRSLPDGFETQVGERGASLSGGQKQRIALARCFLRDPHILLLDEATSALDAESERLVQDALDRLVQGRTVVTIAHRLSTIQKADNIILVEDGRVKESGTFASLMAQPEGLFRQLVEHQTSFATTIKDGDQ